MQITSKFGRKLERNIFNENLVFCGIDNVETNRNDHGKVNAIIGHPLMKTAYAINYHPNKPDRFYAVSGRNDQN
ncbi:unnamed protein product [Rotaria sp. Silwood1]|nr:unnamed protein product [Rotaria sp. Silwood1]